jgi:DNA-binding NtrC family response regulator
MEPIMSADLREGTNGGPELRPLTNKAFLVVEDEALIAMNVESWLQDAGAARVEMVYRLSSARAALDKNDLFDAAIVDFRLADGDASLLIRWLHDRNIPVVVTTGDPLALREHEGPTVTLLEKPYSEKAFIDAIAALLSNDKRVAPRG